MVKVVILDFGKALRASDGRYRLASARNAVGRRHLDPGYNRPDGEGQHTDIWSYSVVLNSYMAVRDFENKATLKKWIVSVQDPAIEVRKMSKLSDVLRILNAGIQNFLLQLKKSEVERVRLC
jgi:hypothetical protein